MARIGWRAVVQCAASSIAVELLTFLCLRLRLNVSAAVCLYLMALLLSLRASLLAWAVVSFVTVSCLGSFLSPAILSFRASNPTEAVAIVAFLTTLVVPAQVEAHE
ncbi:MAG TPA: hypothetical protein VK788_06510 [Terriglobales bacterium]|jgi:hypothetical protein|nr:hypothetical protein [Terriglobales bacterium]